MDPPTYEAIGQDYSRHRAADPRIVGRLVRMLGPPESGALIEVGAGTGNYAAALAKHGYRVVAVEPSATMRSQAEGVSGVCWVEAMAERLRRDLDSGVWAKRHGSVLGLGEFDAGYRFLSTGRAN